MEELDAHINKKPKSNLERSYFNEDKSNIIINNMRKIKFFEEAKKNTMIANRYFFFITLIWFFLSIFCGWIASMLFEPFDFMTYLYENYKPHIDNYNMLCMSIFIAIILKPFAIFFYIKHGFKSLYIKRGKFFISVLGAFSGYAVTDISPMEVSGKYARRLQIILIIFDWIGAFFIVFMGLYLIAFSIIIAINSDERTKKPV